MLLFLLAGVGQVWGEDVVYPNGGSTLNSNWTQSSSRVARQTVNNKVVIQLQAVSSNNYGELYSSSTYSNISSISINATANKNKSATLKLLYSSDNSTWEEVSTETISGDASQTYNDYPLTLTGLPSSAVYIKFQNSGSSNSVYLYSVTITTGTQQSTDCTEPGTALSITSANTATIGTSLTLTSDGGNGGDITWSVTNGTGSATVSGSTLTPVTKGTVTVKATQEDNTINATTY